jgi:hypothetical protein
MLVFVSVSLASLLYAPSRNFHEMTLGPLGYVIIQNQTFLLRGYWDFAQWVTLLFNIKPWHTPTHALVSPSLSAVWHPYDRYLAHFPFSSLHHSCSPFSCPLFLYCERFSSSGLGCYGTTNIVPRSWILSTMKMKATRSSETSVLSAVWHPYDRCPVHSHTPPPVTTHVAHSRVLFSHIVRAFRLVV